MGHIIKKLDFDTLSTSKFLGIYWPFYWSKRTVLGVKSRWATLVYMTKTRFRSKLGPNDQLSIFYAYGNHLECFLTLIDPLRIQPWSREGKKDGLAGNTVKNKKQGKVDMCVYDAYRDGLIRAQRSEDCGVHVWTPTFAHPRGAVGFGSLIFVKRLNILLFSTLLDEFRWSGRHRHHGQLVRQAEPRSRVRNMVGRRSHATHFVHSACIPDAGLLAAGSSQRGIMAVGGRCEIQLSPGFVAED